MQLTHVFNYYLKAINENNKIIISQGGTSSSKTFSFLQLLIIHSLKHKNKLSSVVAESYPHLRRGAMRDFFKILKSLNLYYERNFSKSEKIYTFPTGSQIEFFSADQDDKLRGARRDNLFINECNNVNFAAYNELSSRTTGFEFLDFNPTQEFWAHTELIGKERHAFIKSTYKDNQYLSADIIEKIESRKGNSNWWRIYGLGEIGSFETRVFNKVETIKQFPLDMPFIYCMDLGFKNDPTTLLKVAVDWNNHKVFIEQLLYETGLKTNQLIAKMKALNINSRLPIITDTNEPRLISEIINSGFPNCINANKQNRIEMINELSGNDVFITEKSLETIKEFRNYSFLKNKNGKIINEVQSFDDHSIDPTRYAYTYLYSDIINKRRK